MNSNNKVENELNEYIKSILERKNKIHQAHSDNKGEFTFEYKRWLSNEAWAISFLDDKELNEWVRTNQPPENKYRDFNSQGIYTKEYAYWNEAMYFAKMLNENEELIRWNKNNPEPKEKFKVLK